MLFDVRFLPNPHFIPGLRPLTGRDAPVIEYLQAESEVEETIARSPTPPAAPPALTPDTLAWLLLAACESIAYEPPSAVADRVRTVLELSGHASPVG